MTNQTNPDLPWMIVAKDYAAKGIREVGSTNKGPEILNWTEQLLGQKINTSAPHWVYGQPWCGTFAAICLKESGFTKGSYNSRKGKGTRAGPKHYPFNWYGAGDWRLEGGVPLTKPCYGCVAVKSRAGGNHVAFIVGQTADGRLVAIGGNQGNKVCYAIFSKNDFDTFLWYGNTSQPAAHRYNLPVLKNITASGVSEA